jgi:hypothetical protein
VTWCGIAAGAAGAPASQAHAASVAELNAMAKRFAPVELRAETAGLSKGDRAAIGKLIEAAKIVDTLQLRQRWAGNEALWAALRKGSSPLGKARQHYFWLNKGPWSIIDGNASFMPPDYAGVKIPARKPDGANFYPAGASKEALETWMNGLSAKDKEAAQWFFTVLPAGQGRLRLARRRHLLGRFQEDQAGRDRPRPRIPGHRGAR